MDFTFLTYNQIYGEENLDILRKYGTKCAITDFSILLGGNLANNEFTSEGNSLDNRSGWWWTKTAFINRMKIVGANGSSGESFADWRFIGARPATAYSSISSNNIREINGILEVEYGEYPQTVVSEDYSETLEKAFINMQNSNSEMKITGKCYTTDTSRGRDESFRAKSHIEYEYRGNKYVRYTVEEETGVNEILSDGRRIQVKNSYWVKVEPIKWLVDKKTNIALSKKILFAGVYYNEDIKRYFNGFFELTNIKKFMDKYFSKDIVPSILKKTNTSILEEVTLDENENKEVEKIIAKKRKNPYGFNFEQVSEEDIIRAAIESGVAVFLHGKSSEGKSSRVKQIDPECVIIYLRNATPDSLNGKCVYNSETGEMIDIKPTWLKKLEERCEKEPDKYHIVFFDEITNALPSIQGTAFNIVLDREVNGIWQLPDNARIVAAGNDMIDSLSANQLAEPLFNRFAHVYIETSVDKWLKWASDHKIHPAIYSYIAYKRENALRSKYDGEKPNADPRKWEMASKMLYATGQPEMLRALVGENITKDFCEFCNQNVITLDDVLNEKYNEEDLEMDTSELYATLIGLSQVDEENFKKVREFILKLGEEPCAVFELLWAHGDEKRMEIIAEIRLENTIGGKRI